MSTVYYADNPAGTAGTAASFAARGPAILEGGYTITVPFQFTGPDTGAAHTVFTAADSIQLCKVPAGARILTFLLDYPVWDGSAALTFSAGLVTLGTAIFLSVGTTAQAGGIITGASAIAGSLPSAEIALYSPTTGGAETGMGDIFALLCGTGTSGTPASGLVLKGWLQYTLLRQTVY
jgi:hypothetical protein